jgi:pimeloyl-ACP methyl ester carboxylesterase
MLCGVLILSLLLLLTSPSRAAVPHISRDVSTTGGIPSSLFASLERLARLVDITYCIGSTGIGKPFQCLSRCSEFPTLSLVSTWNTGVLLSDSCGYIAVDHDDGKPRAYRDSDATASGKDSGAIIVAFRGTYSITNTVIDLSTVPQKYVPYPSPDHDGEATEKPEHGCQNCTVHMGFLQSWENARSSVLPELKALKAQHPSYSIHLVGHSLGGAVACLAALELKVSLGWDDITVTTFGEPRVGNYALARFVDEVFSLDGDRELEKRTYRRVTHNNDPVPLLPLDEWGYKAHAGEIYISKSDLPPSDQDLQLCVGDADPTCSDEGTGDAQSKLQQVPVDNVRMGTVDMDQKALAFPTRFKLWQLLFAHRDYFWRLGLCVPGGDPFDWGRPSYDASKPEEL